MTKPSLSRFIDFTTIVFRESLFLLRIRVLGSSLGLIWLIASPFLLALIYSFIMTVVFDLRIGTGTPQDYLIYLLIGMGVFMALSESLNGAITSISSSTALVKNIVFPIAALPLSHMLVSIVTLAIYLLFAASLIIWQHGLTLMVLTLPLWIFLHYLFMAGLCQILATVNVFVRDVQHLLIPLLTLLMFCSPVFYVAEMVPEKFRFLWNFNILAHIIDGYRSILIDGIFPSIGKTSIVFFSGVILTIIGTRLLAKNRQRFEAWV